MTKKLCNKVERELYASRFRRNLNSVTKSLNDPNKTLQRVIIKSRHSELPLFVAVSAAAYAVTVNYVKAHQQFLEKPL
jgi:hypothetical protein